MTLTMNKLFKKLRSKNKREYRLFLFCVTFSIMLITSFSLMLFSSTVQNTFPEGGDSRKQIYMIFAIALLGCFIFTLYATGLFLKYKSRETGVFLVLGAKKASLTKALFVEIIQILVTCISVGILIGGILYCVIWQIFRLILPEAEQLVFNLPYTGIIIGLLFGVLVFICISIQAFGFMKRTNLMDILYEQRKSEPLRSVTRGYGVSGFVFLIVGVVLGYGAPMILATMGKLMPPIWNVVYLLSLIGIYRLITYAISTSKRGKNPQKYYRNIISSSMMKFQGKQTVRNMCIVALLLAAGLFASFYPIQLSSTGGNMRNSPIDFAIHYKLSEDELGKEELYDMADEFKLAITQYDEVIFSELVASGVERDWDDDGNLIENYMEQYEYADFMPVSLYNQFTGENLSIEDGSYYIVKSPEASESFFVKYADMDCVTNPITKDKLSLNYAGMASYQPFSNNGNTRYILNDSNYANVSKSLPENRQTKQILFNVDNLEESYSFAKEIYREFIERASENMAVSGMYDEYQEEQAIAAGETYSYNEKMELDEKNVDLMEYWKYYPVMKILVEKTFFQTFAVFFIVFIFVAIICLAAVGIISYTRSITIGTSNKQLFSDLHRLGANNKYILRSITSQMNKIFVLPTVIASILMYSFITFMLWGNDGRFSVADGKIFILDIAIGLIIFLYQFIVYRISLKRIKEIIGI